MVRRADAALSRAQHRWTSRGRRVDRRATTWKHTDVVSAPVYGLPIGAQHVHGRERCADLGGQANVHSVNRPYDDDGEEL
jgi:hypothetical protein